MSAVHSAPFTGAGETFDLNAKGLDSDQIRVEDYWDRVSGGSWTTAQGNPAALTFAVRSAIADLPTDDEVVYGHTPDGLGHLVHVSELGEVR